MVAATGQGLDALSLAFRDEAREKLAKSHEAEQELLQGIASLQCLHKRHSKSPSIEEQRS